MCMGDEVRECICVRIMYMSIYVYMGVRVEERERQRERERERWNIYACVCVCGREREREVRGADACDLYDLCAHMYILHIYSYTYILMYIIHIDKSRVSRIDEILGLFCRISSL